MNSELDNGYVFEGEDKKPSNKKIIISAVALIAALGIGFGIGKLSKNNNSTLSSEPTSVTETMNPTPTPTSTSVVKEEFTDINDAEALAERAEEIVTYFEELAPASGMTLEKAEEFLKYINNGVVENPTYDDAAFVIDTINDLMVAELGHASDILNEVETEREKKGVLVDYSKFFLDGTQGQKLASEITRLRQAMITNAGKDITKYREEFTELFMKSWILNGYNGEVINAYALEYPGMEALIDLEFLNTCILVGEAKDMVVDNPITMEPMSLKEMQDIANYEECPTGLVDENGVEAGMITLDKSSSDLYAMYTHALLNNRDLSENYGKKLTNN